MTTSRWACRRSTCRCARALIARTRVAATLARSATGRRPNVEAVAETLVRVSQLVVDFPEIAELDLNPLVVDADGVLAADAWIGCATPGDRGGGLAITPYPAELIEQWRRATASG